MLRPAYFAPLSEPFQTSATALAVACMLLIPFGILLSFFTMRGVTHDYLERYQPIVYLEPTSKDTTVKEVVERLEGISGVDKVTKRTPEEAFRALLQGTNAAPSEEVALTPDMLPLSLVVELTFPMVRGEELFLDLRQLSKLEAVIDIDLPNSKAAEFLHEMMLIVIVAAIGSVLSLLLSYMLLYHRLGAYLDKEEVENTLLYQAGAQSEQLRQPTLVRGLILGIVSGGVVSFVLGLGALVWHDAAPLLLGSSSLPQPSLWLIAMVPTAAAIFLGLVAGAAVSRKAIPNHNRLNAMVISS